MIYIVKALNPNPDNQPTTVDLREVTAAWTFHMAVMPSNEAGKSITIRFYDSEGVAYNYTLDGANFPEQGWNEATIEMSEFVDLGLDFANKGLITGGEWGTEYFRIIGDEANFVVDGSTFGLDDTYITDNGTSSGIEKNSAKDKATALLTGNGLLKVVNNPSVGFDIFSITGSLILSSKTDIANVERIPSGVYIVKAGSKSMKFVVE